MRDTKQGEVRPKWEIMLTNVQRTTNDPGLFTPMSKKVYTKKPG
jgi:hypothetical protein